MPKSKRESKRYEGVLFKCVNNADIVTSVSKEAGLGDEVELKVVLATIDQKNPGDEFYVESGGGVRVVSLGEVCGLDYDNEGLHIYKRLEDLEGIPVIFQLNAEGQVCNLELRLS